VSLGLGVTGGVPPPLALVGAGEGAPCSITLREWVEFQVLTCCSRLSAFFAGSEARTGCGSLETRFYNNIMVISTHSYCNM